MGEPRLPAPPLKNKQHVKLPHHIDLLGTNYPNYQLSHHVFHSHLANPEREIGPGGE